MARTRRAVDDIKVSRGEENIFIWCFFLAIVQLVLDGDRGVQVGEVHLHRRPDFIAGRAQRHRGREPSGADADEDARTGSRRSISTHHTLFFNVLCNELKKQGARKYFLSQIGADRRLFAARHRATRRSSTMLPSLVELHEAARVGRALHASLQHAARIMEKTASFLRLRQLRRRASSRTTTIRTRRSTSG